MQKKKEKEEKKRNKVPLLQPRKEKRERGHQKKEKGR